MGRLSTEATLGIIFVYAIATYGFAAFNLTLAGDDWFYHFQSRSMPLWFLQIDRWGALVLWEVFYGNQIVAPLSITILLVVLAFAAFRISALLEITEPVHQILVACLFLSSPILIEHIQFKINHILLAFCVLASVVSVERLVDAERKGADYIIALGLLIFAFGTLQTATLFFATLLTFVCLDRVARTSTPGPHLAAYFGAAALGAVALAGALLIGAGLKAMLGLPPIPVTDNHNYDLNTSLTGFQTSAAQTAAYVSNFLLGEQIGWHRLSKLLFLVFVASFLARSLSRVLRAPARALVLVLFALFLVLPFFLGFLREGWSSFRYTAMFALMLTYPLVVGAVLRDARGRFVPHIFAGLAGLIALQFAQGQNQAALATAANNTRDRFEVARMYDRIEGLRDADVARLRVVGRLDAKGGVPFGLPFDGAGVPFGQRFIINECAVLACQPRHLSNVLRSVGYFPGLEVEELPVETFERLGIAGAEARAAWPSDRSIFREGDSIYVILSR